MTTTTVQREWLSYREITEYCGISRWSILRAIQSDELPAAKFERAVRVRRSDLDAWLESQKG